MEVFLRNVPAKLKEESLKQELQPHMNKLGILEWTVEKPNHRSQAWVTFLHISDGEKFLGKHGEVKFSKQPEQVPYGPSFRAPNLKGKEGSIAKLHILRTPVYVSASTRRVNAHTLSHLKLQRETKSRSHGKTAKSSKVINFGVHKLSWGNNMYNTRDNILVFGEQFTEPSEPGSLWQARLSSKLLSLNGDGTRLDFPLETIQDLIASYERSCITLVLTESPRIYKARPFVNFDTTTWNRVQSTTDPATNTEGIERCLVVNLLVNGQEFADTMIAIRLRDILSVTGHDLPVISARGLGEVNINNFEKKAAQCLSSNTLPFPLLFQVAALVWNNYLLPFAGSQMLDALAQVSRDAENRFVSPVTVASMKPLFQLIPFPCPGVESADLDVTHLVNITLEADVKLRKQDPSRHKLYGSQIPEKHAWVFKALVTPTRIMLAGPDAESKNRVLRLFPKHNDYFLRVVFCEENGEDLGFNPRVSNDAIHARYRKVLQEGITIAGRKFAFLGFSHSSLRSHSAWFSAPFIDDSFEHQNCDTILKSLGDFKSIQNAAKCAARIGQAFSEIPYSVSLMKCEINVRYIEDVKTADGSRVFSDGVGTISQAALAKVWSYLGSNTRGGPTCIQIRLGGCKGMLSLDTRLVGRSICIRKESMEKFPSLDQELGICDTANKPLRLYLNRQVIKILEDMGTDSKWFFKEQNKALEVLRVVTTSSRNTSTFLESQNIGTAVGLPRLIKELGKMGIDYKCDTFLRSAVEHVVLGELRLLKHKARIPIENGVTLFGIMDETGFLKEGQVYVTYDRKYKHTGIRINNSLKDGPLIVTRSPALHPGDIQVATMVTPPKGHPLQHLQNCIVFSQKGTRDLPSQLSGGDLDGDLYNVIWDFDAWPARRFLAADYPRVTPKSLNRPVTRDDIADFFIDFMKSDLLGMIAIRHVTFADVTDEGTVSPQCLSLANMHSTAVDFSKTGEAVEPKKMPRPPRTRPDFLAPAPPIELYSLGQIKHIANDDEYDAEETMGLSQPRYHRSEKILGQLYRSIDEKRIWEENIHFDIQADGPTVWEQLLGVCGARISAGGYDVNYRLKLDEAWRIRELYESFVSDIIQQYSINPRKLITEVEAFCGFILNKKGSQTRRQRDSSIKLKDEIERVMAIITRQILDFGAAEEGESIRSNARMTDDVIELAWACVVVGCEPPSDSMTFGLSNFQSFKVVAGCCLVRQLESLPKKMDEVVGGGFPGVGGGWAMNSTLPIR